MIVKREHWADEIISNKNFNLVVNGIEELICNPHPFTQLLHDAISCLLYTSDAADE